MALQLNNFAGFTNTYGDFGVSLKKRFNQQEMEFKVSCTKGEWPKLVVPHSILQF